MTNKQKIESECRQKLLKLDSEYQQKLIPYTESGSHTNRVPPEMGGDCGRARSAAG